MILVMQKLLTALLEGNLFQKMFCALKKHVKHILISIDYMVSYFPQKYCRSHLKIVPNRIVIMLSLIHISHIAGNVYTEEVQGIQVHRYGAHIFHTNSEQVWQYVGRFARFNRYTNSPMANYKGELYNLPFNMNTFNRLWGVTTPAQAMAEIERQRAAAGSAAPKNLEQQAISLVGTDIYEKLVKGYTEKQWGRPCRELPAFIIRRLPVRFTFDNNYFNAMYQGIPIGGYTAMVQNMLEGTDVRLNTDYLAHKAQLDALARRVVYCLLYTSESRCLLPKENE